MLARIPSPVFSTLDSVTNGTPCCWACSSCFATTERVTALRITASAPWRSAVPNAFCSCSGEPSVPIVLAVQPRSAAPCLMMSPWTSHASTPQLMKAIFLPVGMGLPMGARVPMLSGRALDFSASARAAATPSPPSRRAARAAARLASASARHHCDDDGDGDRGGEHQQRRSLARAVPLLDLD